jgi:hypothetical protein
MTRSRLEPRGSAFFTESVAAGRPIVASRGTFAGTSVENNQAEGEVFALQTSEAERARDCARSHSPGAYVDVLLARAKT